MRRRWRRRRCVGGNVGRLVDDEGLPLHFLHEGVWLLALACLPRHLASQHPLAPTPRARLEGTTTVTRRGWLAEMDVTDTCGELLRLAGVGAPVLVRGELEGAREDEGGVITAPLERLIFLLQ